ncbi:ubiquitin-like isoform X2 [Sinocyclocheilus anshuiensis]|uniref:ubiquitin-like isoform X2 n=1 Tax=Sinocyclocheilus anshuiensis TaxID=1608454 RepID=UPI0007BA126E|nr:PREDICTED: ubiquitin-like isoform X2 [Sinocyclocheilus anshuiensis]
MSFNIFIKYEIGQLRAVSVDSEEELKNTTVEELRRRAFPEDQWDALVFIFEGRQLEEGRTLGSYGVLNESTIHAVLRLRGGAPPEDEDVGMSRTASMEVLASMQQTEPEPNRSCLIL